MAKTTAKTLRFRRNVNEPLSKSLVVVLRWFC